MTSNSWEINTALAGIALMGLVGLAGCTGTPAESTSWEIAASSTPAISIAKASTECSSEVGYVTLSIRNEGDQTFVYNSNEPELSVPKIETILRNENGRGFAKNAMYYTATEGVAPGANGELYAAFGGLFTGFEGSFNKIEVMVDGELVLEQDISLSNSDCG